MQSSVASASRAGSAHTRPGHRPNTSSVACNFQLISALRRPHLVASTKLKAVSDGAEPNEHARSGSVSVLRRPGGLVNGSPMADVAGSASNPGHRPQVGGAQLLIQVLERAVGPMRDDASLTKEQLESLILELRDLKAAVTRMEGAQQGEAGQQGPLELGQLGPEQGQGQQDGTGVPEQDEQQQVEEQLQAVATTADGVTEDGPILPVAPMLVPPAPDTDGEDEMWLNTEELLLICKAQQSDYSEEDRPHLLARLGELLARGVSPNARDRSGWTALHNACSWGHLDMAELLLGAGADPACVTEDGSTPLHLAAERGHAAVVKLLVAAGTPLDAPNKDGRTALHLAAFWGFCQALEALLGAEALVNATDKNGCTALHLAATEGHSRLVARLLAEGAAVDAKDRWGYTALHRSSSEGHTKVVERMVAARAHLDATTTIGWTALHLSSSHGHHQAVERLLKAGAHVDAADEDGRTSLHLASFWGYTKVVERLLAAGADVGVQAKDGDTPLDRAVKAGQSPVVELLRVAAGSPSSPKRAA